MIYKIAWTNIILLIIQEASSNKKIFSFISQAKSLSQSKMCCQPREREKVQHHQVPLVLKSEIISKSITIGLSPTLGTQDSVNKIDMVHPYMESKKEWSIKIIRKKNNKVWNYRFPSSNVRRLWLQSYKQFFSNVFSKKLFTSQLNILWRSKWEKDWGEAIPSLQSMFKQHTIV